jgi:hypothetical protein
VKIATAKSARPKKAMRVPSGENLGNSISVRRSSSRRSLPLDRSCTRSSQVLRVLVKITWRPSGVRSG